MVYLLFRRCFSEGAVYFLHNIKPGMVTRINIYSVLNNGMEKISLQAIVSYYQDAVFQKVQFFFTQYQTRDGYKKKYL